jgi:sortase (surface protein transpeptidase)
MGGARRLGRGGAVLLAVIVGLVGAGLVTFAIVSQASPSQPRSVSAGSPERHATGQSPTASPRAASPGPASPPTESPSAASPSPAEGGGEDQISGPVLPQSRPVSIRIPSLDVRSTLVDLGVDDAGAMEVPSDPADAGWFELGPTPGALGPAVIAGHVSWNRQPAVFFRLAELRRGDRVSVERADGQTAVFAVREVSRFAKSRFPTDAVYGGIDHAGLRLITCGGAYDDAANRYLDNVVVFARQVAVRPTQS